ncbi:MAG: chromate transporter [Tidjanibacter sp.]|nr:chromate transporter [Tidjanibacter sp.]
MSSLWTIFISFLKIGAFTFGGGYAMIPLIEAEMIQKRSWLNREEFINLLIMAQSIPGPIALNTAVFVGYKTRGWKGAFAALLGVVIPSFVIILLIATVFTDFKDNHYVAAAFKGMRPAVVALIAAPLIGMSKGMSWWKILLAVGAAAAIWLAGLSPIWFIFAGAVVGVAWSFRNEGVEERVDTKKGKEEKL